MMYTHVVFDDLREFSPAQPDTVYLRTVDEARTFFADPNVCVDTLWLDFDLGLDTSGNSMVSETIINELVERVMTDQPAPEIRSIYIVTANNVGQRRLMFSCPTIAPHVKVVNPIDYCLVNLQRW